MNVKRLLTTFLLGCSCLLHAQPDGLKRFQYDAFETTRKLKLLGSARLIPGGVRLTPNVPYQHGACWYQEQVAVEKGFEVEFVMRMTRPDLELGGADGIAFVIHCDPRGLGVGQMGEGIGYAGIRNALVVEFDSFDNFEGSDHHVSIQNNGTGEVNRFEEHSLGLTHRVPTFRNRTTRVKIKYHNNLLSVYVNNALVLTRPLHLERQMGLNLGKAWVGFTASTAKAFARNEILYWRWESVDIPIAVAPKLPIAPLTPIFRIGR